MKLTAAFVSLSTATSATLAVLTQNTVALCIALGFVLLVVGAIVSTGVSFFVLYARRSTGHEPLLELIRALRGADE